MTRRMTTWALTGLAAGCTMLSVSANAGLGESDADAAPSRDPIVCGSTEIELVIDHTRGTVSLKDAAGALTRFEGTLYVGLGMLQQVRVRYTFWAGEWEVELSPDGQETRTYVTSGSSVLAPLPTPALSHPIDTLAAFDLINDDPSQIPTAPTVVIRTSKTCPSPPQQPDP